MLAGAERALTGLLAGALLGGLVIGALLVTRRIGARSYVPFGPFLIAGALWRDGVEQRFTCERNTTYRLQAQALISGSHATLASLQDGENVVHLVKNIEIAATQARWMET